MELFLLLREEPDTFKFWGTRYEPRVCQCWFPNGGSSLVNHLPHSYPPREFLKVILTLQVIFILQGCFWRPSKNVL